MVTSSCQSAVLAQHRRQMRTAAAHRASARRPAASGSTRAIGRSRGDRERRVARHGVQRVLDVQIAERSAPLRRPPGSGRSRSSADSCSSSSGVTPSRARRPRARAGSTTSPHRPAAQLQRVAQPLGWTRSSSSPASPESAHHPGQLVVGEGRGDLVLGLDPQQLQQAVGEGVDREDHRPQRPGERHQRRAEQQRASAPARPARCSSAPSRRAACADTSPAPARSRRRSGGPAPSGTPTAWNTGSSRCAMAGSATTPSTSVHSVMPSWAAASSAETCSRPHSDAARPPVALLGVRLDLAAAYGDQRELGADEEGVDDQRQQADEQLDRGHRRLPPPARRRRARPAARAAAPGRRGARAASTTSSRQPPTSSASPSAGMRPSSVAIRPASVSYGPSGRAQPDRAPAGRCGRRRPPSYSARARPRPSPAGARSGRLVRVVLVADLADDLLDDVLQGHDARPCRRTRR